MAKLLNSNEERASKFFVSCIDLATRLLIFDAEAPQNLKESVFLLNESLRKYELMDQPELVSELRRMFYFEDLSRLTWEDYLLKASAVFAFRLSLGGAYEDTENCQEIVSQLSDIMHMLEN